MIMDNSVEVGMPIDAFILVKGYPTTINTTTTAKGSIKQYVYGTSNPSYYYFENAKLVAKQISF